MLAQSLAIKNGTVFFLVFFSKGRDTTQAIGKKSSLNGLFNKKQLIAPR